MNKQQMKERKMKDKTNCATFTESNFKNEVIKSSQPVLAVFEADWSGTCHIMMPILDSLCEQFRGSVKIGLIDIDGNPKLAADYGISNLPSLIFFRNGEIVGHITGSVPKQIIAAKLIDMVPSKNK
jgi:thioredoxin 1